MYTKFEIENFRGLSRVVLNPLARVNLIAGTSNIGKTSVLEAIFLHCGGANPDLALRILGFRGFEKLQVELEPNADAPWSSMFENYDFSRPITLVGISADGVDSVLKVRESRDPQAINYGSIEGSLPARIDIENSSAAESVQVLQFELESHSAHKQEYSMVLSGRGAQTVPSTPPSPPHLSMFLAARTRTPFAEDAKRFGSLEVRNQQHVVVETLRILDQRIKRLAISVIGDTPVIHADIGIGRLIPIPFMGEGIARMLGYIVCMANANGGVLLIDEIENGLHHSVLTSIWQAIGKAAERFNVQVFATTHSLECIVAAHNAFSEESDYPFRLHRLDRIEGAVRAITYDQESLSGAIALGLEVR